MHDSPNSTTLIYATSPFITTVPKPKSRLTRYRVLSPHASVHVSPLQIRATSIGDKWGKVMGSMNRESSFEHLDTFYDALRNELAGGKLHTDEEEERRAQSCEKGRVMMGSGWKRNDAERAIGVALEEVAKEVSTK